MIFSSLQTKKGSALILVIFAITIIVSITLSASVTIRLKQAVMSDVIERNNARRELISEIAVSLHALVSDTNEIDSISEEWCFENKTNNSSVSIKDEYAKININTADENTISSLFSSSSNIPADKALVVSHNIVSWRELQKTKPEIIELYKQVDEMNDETMEILSKYTTVYGNGKININTVQKEVFRALLISFSKDETVVSGLIEGFEKARKNEIILEEINSTALSGFLFGDGMIPSQKQYEVIQKLSEILVVKSDCFGGIAEYRGGNDKRILKQIYFSYEKEKMSFKKWIEF